MIEQLLDNLSRIHHRLFTRTKLEPFEQSVLEAWRKTLSTLDQDILDQQLKAVYLVQRQAGGAKICFFCHDDKSIPTFSNVQPDFHAATVSLRSLSGTETQTLRAKIFLHNGRFFSIEFPKRPARYAKLHGMDLNKVEVFAVEAKPI